MTQHVLSTPRGDVVRAAVLGLLGTRGPSSRADIARALGVSPATVTQTTKELLARDLVVELASVPSQGGRPARLLGLADAATGAIGAKVTADHVRVVAVGLNGTVRSAASFDLDAFRPRALDVLVDILGSVIAAYDGPLLGVGVGVPGAVDGLAAGVVDAPTLGWDRVPVGPRLRSALDLPVLVDNDVNTLAAAETLYGTGREHDDVLVVTIGRGVGLGIVQDRVVTRGAHGGAGEFGHTPVAADGPLCGCGNTGCLEAFVGESGLLAAARAGGALDERGTVADLARAAHAGDPAARGVYADAGALLGRTLAGAVHLLDPEVVVLLGEGIGEWPFWEDAFEDALRRHLMPTRRGVPVLVEPWTEDQWAVGAASLVIGSPFDAGSSGREGELVRARLQSAAGVR